MDAHDARIGLTSIRGIGAKTAAALAALGIADAAGLIERRPDADALRLALTDAGIRGLTSERIDAWFDDAEALTAATTTSRAAPSMPASASSGEGRHGEFTIFFDASTSGGDVGWRCRVYHAESGDEEELDGLDSWLAWVAGKLGVAVADLMPDSVPDGRRRDAHVAERAESSRLQVAGLEVAPARDGHLVFEVTLLLGDEVGPTREPPTAHVDLVCLDRAGRVALAESWDEAIASSPHVARRTTTGLGLGEYDVRVTVTLAMDDGTAERALMLELVP